jgi:hypothetical protein
MYRALHRTHGAELLYTVQYMQIVFVLSTSTHSYKVKYADPLPVWELWANKPMHCMYVCM